jgi:hypothetical protein
MITKLSVVVRYYVQILFISDRQYAQLFFLFSHEYFRCLYLYCYMFRVDRLIIRNGVNLWLLC